MIYGYIYKTENLKNKKIYIGKRKGRFDRSYLGSGMILKRAIKEHGRNSFKLEAILFADNLSQLDEFEKHMIEKYREILGRDNLYNISDGGGGFSGKKHSPETKKIMSEKRSGDKNPNYGKDFKGEKNPSYGRKMSQEQRDFISKMHKGIKRPELSILYRGRTPWNKGIKMNHVPWNKGKPWPQEIKEKMRLAKRGKS